MKRLGVAKCGRYGPLWIVEYETRNHAELYLRRNVVELAHKIRLARPSDGDRMVVVYEIVGTRGFADVTEGEA